MNYYPHHIGDYAKATRFLSKDQDLFYRRMLDEYYDRESPLPGEPEEVAQMVGATTPEEIDAVRYVLARFFTPTGSGWMNARCEQEIGNYRVLVERNRKNGALGGRPKKVETQSKPSGFPVGTQSKANQNQNQRKEKTSLSGEPDGLREQAKQVLAHLNSQSGSAFKNVDSNLRLIAARLGEGHSIDDCRRVVDAKVRDWKGTEYAKFLRPETLFNPTKFNGYAGQLASGLATASAAGRFI